MKQINLLDCTLRDGGYINDWNFGEIAIPEIISKLEQSQVEMIELGFFRNGKYDANKSLFPTTKEFKNVLRHKKEDITYVAMLDMSKPIPKENIYNCDHDSIDGIRVIFKKNKINEAYDYVQDIKNKGYKVFVNFVSTDQYTDIEFITSIKKFNQLKPDAMTIVDTFGMIRRRDFIRMVMLADNTLDPDIMLCYHAHNNLQQAFSNAETMLELNLKRDICIDACVFGMGRGAGNLNLELFAGFLNEYYNKNYQIKPILEIMDEYLSAFYKKKFWGYSLPLYLSASLGCHPNYAVFYGEKNTINVAEMEELLKGLPTEDKKIFNKTVAEKYYIQYMNNYIDDKLTLDSLAKIFADKQIFIVAPGESFLDNYKLIENKKEDIIIITINFLSKLIATDFVFFSNLRHLNTAKNKIKNERIIISSNITDFPKADYIVNYSTYTSKYSEIVDNGGLMLLKILCRAGVKNVNIIGMDGYSDNAYNYYNSKMTNPYPTTTTEKNNLIAKEITALKQVMSLNFLTPSVYVSE